MPFLQECKLHANLIWKSQFKFWGQQILSFWLIRQVGSCIAPSPYTRWVLIEYTCYDHFPYFSRFLPPLFRFQLPASFLPRFRPLSHHLACGEFDKAGWGDPVYKETFDITTFYSHPRPATKAFHAFIEQQLSYGANVLKTIYIPRNCVVYARQLAIISAQFKSL